ncbi:hypothetical protein [Erythrobacter sp. EC-HK427]|uniref:hypothetical protein n=1 Tax=Erythrobacter sp. EC-HK427 TaxID=2038396 RepID=UPI00125F11EE|nr:hypothetical protein [Erythrobacter sp. EC-HK427]
MKPNAIHPADCRCAACRSPRPFPVAEITTRRRKSIAQLATALSILALVAAIGACLTSELVL